MHCASSGEKLPKLNEIKIALQNQLGDTFQAYWNALRNWILNPTVLDDLQFVLEPILKDSHELIHLHNLYLRTLLNVASTDEPVIKNEETEQQSEQVNEFTTETKRDGCQPVQSPRRRFRPLQRIRRRGFRRSQQEDIPDENMENNDDNETEETNADEEMEMEVDDVRSPSPEEHVPLFEVYVEPVTRKRRIQESDSESENEENEEDEVADLDFELEAEEDVQDPGEGQEQDAPDIDEEQEQEETEAYQEEEEQQDLQDMDFMEAVDEAEQELEQTNIDNHETDEAEVAVGEVEQVDIPEPSDSEQDQHEPDQLSDVDGNAEADTGSEVAVEDEENGNEEEDVEEEEEPGSSDSPTDIETEESEEEEQGHESVPIKFLEDVIESKAPRRGSLEIVPNVTHINKLLQKYIGKEPNLGRYFSPRKGPDQPFLTSNASVQGRMLKIVWKNGLDKIQTAAVNYILEATKSHITTIIKALVRKRKSFQVSDDDPSPSYGKSMANPYLVHGGDERFHEINSTQKPDTDLPHVPPNVTAWDERERQVVYQIARRCTPNPPKYETKVGPTELYEAIQLNKGLISSHLKTELIERLLMKMRGHNESVKDDDDKNNNSKEWESQEEHHSLLQLMQNGNGNGNYNLQEEDEDEDEDDMGELYPVYSY